MLIDDHLLLNYKRCHRRTFLEIYGDRQLQDPEKEFVAKLKRENKTHISNVIRQRWLKACEPNTSFGERPQASRRDWQLNAAQTVALMASGADYIVNGSLVVDSTQWQASLTDRFRELLPWQHQEWDSIIFVAAPTILIKQPGKSKFGDWEYFPVNIKLGRRAKPEYKLIAAFHAQVLALTQETISSQSQLILKEHQDYWVNMTHWLSKMQYTIVDCLTMLLANREPEVFISRQRCNLCHWYSHCYHIAKSTEHLSLVPGVTPGRYEHLQAIGIRDFESLVAASESHLQEILEGEVARQIKQQAIALKSDRPLVRSGFDLVHTQPIPTGAIELYFDIEAEPERQIDYLLGVLLVDRTNNSEQFYAFLAETPDQEAQIWQQFLDFVALYPDAPIFHYSEYEADTIIRLSKLYDTPRDTTQELLSRLVDLHLWVMRSAILPVESYSLKALANWIGFAWRDSSGSGDRAVCWYDRWLLTQDRDLLELILNYNEDDCRATRHLKDWLLDFLEHQRNLQIVNLR